MRRPGGSTRAGAVGPAGSTAVVEAAGSIAAAAAAAGSMRASSGVDVVSSVPLTLYPAYRDGPVVVRSADPVTITTTCPEWDRDRVVGVELESLDADSDPLATW